MIGLVTAFEPQGWMPPVSVTVGLYDSMAETSPNTLHKITPQVYFQTQARLPQLHKGEDSLASPVKNNPGTLEGSTPATTGAVQKRIVRSWKSGEYTVAAPASFSF